MNKVTTLHVSGIVFNIEEEGYFKLRDYLDLTKRSFSGTEGGTEIYNDIEARVAEIFNERIGHRKEVILLQDVEDMIVMMGKPEEFSPERESTTHPQLPAHALKKRLFRDLDDKIVAGVCSGLGAYFDINPIWFRLIFGFTILSFGSGLLLYFLLWVCMPKASTSAQKLEMHHQPVNLVSLKKAVVEKLNSSTSTSQSDWRKIFKDKKVQLIILALLIICALWIWN
jgi:phage shock protein PspC (stress-responsive transcriptional regulator)